MIKELERKKRERENLRCKKMAVNVEFDKNRYDTR